MQKEFRRELQRYEESQESFEANYNQFGDLIKEISAWKDYVLEVSGAYAKGYQWYSLEKEPKLKGISYEGLPTKYLIPIYPEDMVNLADTAYEILDTELFKYALPIIAYGNWDDRKPLAKAIKSYNIDAGITMTDEVETLHCTKLSKMKLDRVKSFIPELWQFPKSLLDLKLTRSDFLGWVYSDSEIDMMSLHCGRAAHFPQGAIPAGEKEPVTHSYRNLLVLQSDPHFGKSLFMTWLEKTFTKLGLRVCVIQDLSKQFGHGPWVSSAISYIDDTTEKDIQYAFNSALLKSVCSNGKVNVESKGVNHVTIKAMTAPFVLANNIDQRHLANADDGNANRIKIVACKNKYTAAIAAQNLPSTSPLYGIDTLTPGAIIQYLCDKACVSQEVLGAYFIRLCLDYFESFDRQSLTDKIEDISNNLYLGYSTNSINTLAKTAVLSYILKQATFDGEALRALQTSNIGAGNSAAFIMDSLSALADLTSRMELNTGSAKVKALIKENWLNTGSERTHCWMTFRNYSAVELCALGLRAQESKLALRGRGEKTGQSLDSIYAEVFKDLKDIRGNPSVFSVSRIETAFKNALVLYITSITGVYNFILESDSVALEEFQVTSSEAKKLLTEYSTTIVTDVNIPNGWHEGFTTPVKSRKSFL